MVVIIKHKCTAIFLFVLSSKIATQAAKILCEASGHTDAVLLDKVTPADVKCRGSGDPRSILNWSLRSRNDSAIHPVASCHGANNCTVAKAFRSQFSALWSVDSIDATLRLLDRSTPFSGNLTCTETTKGGLKYSDTCALRVQGVAMHGCYDNLGLILYDGGRALLHCDIAPSLPLDGSSLEWSWLSEDGRSQVLGTCLDNGTCSSMEPNVDVKKTERRIQISIPPDMVNRSIDQIICSFSTGDSTVYPEICSTDIRSADTLLEEQLKIRPDDWSFVFSVFASNMFSSKNRYTLYLRQSYLDVARDFQERYWETSKDFTDNLVLYTSEGKQFYQARITHTWPIPPAPANYFLLSYRVHHPSKKITSFFKIDPPTKDPDVSCTVLNVDSATDPCICTVQSLGTPQGRLVWLLGNAVVARGNYNVTSLTFPALGEDVVKGDTATCLLDWVASRRTTIAVKRDETDKGVWIAVGGAAVLAVVAIVVAVVVFFVWRKKCRLCMDSQTTGQSQAHSMTSASNRDLTDGPLPFDPSRDTDHFERYDSPSAPQRNVEYMELH